MHYLTAWLDAFMLSPISQVAAATYVTGALLSGQERDIP